MAGVQVTQHGVVVRIDTSDGDKVIAALKAAPKEALAALISATNKTGASCKTLASREIRKIYNISKERLDNSFEVYRATYTRPWFEIRATGKRPGLQNFGPHGHMTAGAIWYKNMGAGVGVEVFKGRHTVIKRGIIPTNEITSKEYQSKTRWSNAPAKVAGVYIRTKEMVNPKRGRWKGYRIKVGPNKGKLIRRPMLRRLFGPSVVEMFRRADVQKAVEKLFFEKFPSTFDHELKWRLERMASGTGARPAARGKGE